MVCQKNLLTRSRLIISAGCCLEPCILRRWLISRLVPSLSNWWLVASLRVYPRLRIWISCCGGHGGICSWSCHNSWLLTSVNCSTSITSSVAHTTHNYCDDYDDQDNHTNYNAYDGVDTDDN